MIIKTYNYYTTLCVYRHIIYNKWCTSRFKVQGSRFTNLTGGGEELCEECVFKIVIPAAHCQTLLGLHCSLDTTHCGRGLKLHTQHTQGHSQWGTH